MAKCVFCHGGPDRHTAACPMTIPTTWDASAGTQGELWAVLARTLVEAWRADSSAHDRGSSQDESRLETLWDGLDRALGQGDLEGAMELLYAYHNPEGSAPTPGHGSSGEDSPQGDTC
jgi:hypothetical protein